MGQLKIAQIISSLGGDSTTTLEMQGDSDDDDESGWGLGEVSQHSMDLSSDATDDDPALLRKANEKKRRTIDTMQMPPLPNGMQLDDITGSSGFAKSECGTQTDLGYQGPGVD